MDEGKGHLVTFSFPSNVPPHTHFHEFISDLFVYMIKIKQIDSKSTTLYSMLYILQIVNKKMEQQPNCLPAL